MMTSALNGSSGADPLGHFLEDFVIAFGGGVKHDMIVVFDESFILVTLVTGPSAE